MKPVRTAISYVIRNGEKILIVKRPDDDKELPSVWGLPAGSVKNGESPEKSAIRSGKEKLGVKIKILKLISEGELERKDYILHMKLYESEVMEGRPKVPQPFNDVTQYQQLRLGTPDDLKDAARKGSLCCRLYLSSLHETW